MTDTPEEESNRRLESLRTAWDFDLLRQTAARGAPILQELGLPTDAAENALSGGGGGLEGAAPIPPTQLEAIVRAVGRPPLLVRTGPRGTEVVGKDGLPIADAPKGFPAGIAGMIGDVEPALPMVGRIQFYNHDMLWGGTGWVFDRKDDGTLLVITNRHVARHVARRTWMGGAVFMMNSNNVRYGASIDFLKEDRRMEDRQRDVRIDAFTYIADDLAADIALARITPGTADGSFAPEPLTISGRDAKNGDLIGICGYPASDGGRNDRTEMERYFQGLYDVKRFSPGYIIHPRADVALSHDATTTGGSSGSPVILIDGEGTRGTVVGLHFAGSYGVGNSAVRASTLLALRDEGATGSVIGAGLPPESRDGTHEPEHFEGREGYDPEFLQVQPVPLPVPSDMVPLSTPIDAPADSPNELCYQHFSVLYSGRVKMPIITALNIDGSRTQAVKDYGRWHKDLRIPAEDQLSEEEYGHDDIDRGHMVRRAATNWGPNEDVANLSNRDSYHYPVAAPQHRRLNRNSATWLGLENYILYSARTHGFKASVFTGPILRPSDPQLGETGAPVPAEFFKVVVMAATMPDDPEVLRLHATAYILSQGELITDILSARGRVEATEGFAYGEYKTFQVRIADLEAQTGHDFGPLREFDPLDRIESIQSGAALAVTVEDLRQIRL